MFNNELGTRNLGTDVGNPARTHRLLGAPYGHTWGPRPGWAPAVQDRGRHGGGGGAGWGEGSRTCWPRCWGEGVGCALSPPYPGPELLLAPRQPWADPAGRNRLLPHHGRSCRNQNTQEEGRKTLREGWWGEGAVAVVLSSRGLGGTGHTASRIRGCPGSAPCPQLAVQPGAP